MANLPTENALDVAHRLADAARAAILPHFRAVGLAAENKQAGGFDPVTVADRAAEEAMRAVLAEFRPEDGILGEEFADLAGQSGLTWTLDPIDGTRGFISGTPTWGVLIALGDADGVHLGMIDQPYIGERFWGVDGEAWLDGPAGLSRIGVRRGRTLDQATIFTTFPEVGSDLERRCFEAVAGKTRLVRYGTDCYAYALLAAGQIDLVIEAGLQPYDIRGPIGLIQNAGGIVTDWNGGSAENGGRALAAADPALHAEVLEILSNHVGQG